MDKGTVDLARLAAIDAVIPALREMVRGCRVCANVCEVDRTTGERGLCRTDAPDAAHVRVASHTLHFGEEPMLVGTRGSGTVFFTHCNLRCVFCQNWQISQARMGDDISARELADRFLELQSRGAHNINLVTPTHVIFPIVLAVRDAVARGLRVPIVYNTNGYDRVEFLRLLEPVVDIWLPDLKYMDAEKAKRYSRARDYPETARAALLEMVRQKGELRVDEHGVATRGVILRHLVMPHDIGGTYDLLLWLADEGLTDVAFSLMSQYTPQNKAGKYPELADPVPLGEYRRIVEYALDLGFTHLLVQDFESRENGLPDFARDEPFEWR